MTRFKPDSLGAAMRCLGCAALFGLSACLASSAQIPTASNSPSDGQTATGTTSSQSTMPGAPSTADTGAEASATATASLDAGTGAVLSATQIETILQERPEVVVELKSYLADSLSQQGTPVQPDSITDEALYSQIATSREVRAGITAFLRARGFVSDEELQRAALIGGDSSMAGSDLMQTPLLGGSPFGSQIQSGQQGLPTAVGPTGTETGNTLRVPGQAVAETQRNRTVGETHTSTDEPQVLRRPAPYNLTALRDLYTQIPSSPEKLRRFGSEVFVNRSAPIVAGLSMGSASVSQPLDIPIGPDYVIGPGDTLNIDLWGGVTQTLPRVVDREGRIMLPESGEMQVAGLTLGRAESVIASALQTQFRNAHVAVTVARLRTIRIYVVGDVQRPGAYDVSSLASPLSALYAAGGPTSAGSLRVLRHQRNDKLIGEIDLYDFLLRGIREDDDRLEGGDTLLVPPAGPQVAIYGAVKRPAIYELNKEKSLCGVAR